MIRIALASISTHFRAMDRLSLSQQLSKRLVATISACLTSSNNSENDQKSLKDKAISPINSRDKTHEKARSLIFGSRTYQQFSDEEKKLVDDYQQMVSNEDPRMTLPNTAADEELKEAAALLQVYAEEDRKKEEVTTLLQNKKKPS